MYFYKLDSVQEFAYNFWFTRPSPDRLAHELDAWSIIQFYTGWLWLRIS